MTVERTLSEIEALANARRTGAAPHEREAAAAILVRLGRIRLAIAREPSLTNLVADVLAAARLLHESAQPPHTPAAPTARRYTHEQLWEALRSTKTRKAAAAKAGCSRRTLERRAAKLLCDTST